MFRPRASSSQSPLCSGHPSMGIRHDAPLLLLSPPDPLRWAPAGAPIFCADRKLPKSCQRWEGFRVPYPFYPFGTFPPDRGSRPPIGCTPRGLAVTCKLPRRNGPVADGTADGCGPGTGMCSRQACISGTSHGGGASTELLRDGRALGAMSLVGA